MCVCVFQVRNMLALCTNVEYLDLSYCNISDEGLARYCTVLLLFFYCVFYV